MSDPSANVIDREEKSESVMRRVSLSVMRRRDAPLIAGFALDFTDALEPRSAEEGSEWPSQVPITEFVFLPRALAL